MPTGEGSVQSISRAFEILEVLAQEAPVSLSTLARRAGLPLSTVHRLVGTLVSLGYVRADTDKRYALSPRMIHLGERSARMVSHWALPHLARLVDELGETANLAQLDGDRVVYVAQVPSRHSMRMFTEVGRRVDPHCTAVGKALLARLPDSRVDTLIERTGLVAHTPHTITTVGRLHEELATIRGAGYAVDDEEQELGVRCVAVALDDGPLRLALSVSGPVSRMSADLVDRAVPALRATAAGFVADLAAPDRADR
ncbi:IclR family transcriptional regulator [Nocardioides sp.]|uniref:IclR family transcriptional regulator n=1 Tax=Nocardioides sp. TaxID=35761 RepID=UPI002ED41B5C